MGQAVTPAVARATEAHQRRREVLEAAEQARRQDVEAIDLTRPAPPLHRGRLHPVTLATREIRRIFAQLGYMAVEGPELEYDRYNFELVNMPPGHPARDTQDTFFIDDYRLLRTHTSPVQIRAMTGRAPPFRFIAPGRVYRHDLSPRHSPMFHQVEGFWVDEHVTFGDLKGLLYEFLSFLMGREVELRFRSSFFPFTEPSAEMDYACLLCNKAGCATCSQAGWIEAGGCGMIHPSVLRNCKIDPEMWQGFAFGMTLDRTAMLRHSLPHIRLLFDGDMRVLEQL